MVFGGEGLCILLLRFTMNTPCTTYYYHHKHFACCIQSETGSVDSGKDHDDEKGFLFKQASKSCNCLSALKYRSTPSHQPSLREQVLSHEPTNPNAHQSLLLSPSNPNKSNL